MKKIGAFLFTSNILWIVTATLLSAGILILIIHLTWIEFPAVYWGFQPVTECTAMVPTAAWMLAGGSLTGVFALIQLETTKPLATDAEYSKKMFGRCLVGIGFVLLIDAVVNVVAVAGFANAGSISVLFQGAIVETKNTSTTKETVINSSLLGATNRSEINTNSTIARAETKTESTSQETIEDRRPNYFRSNLIKAIQMLFALGLTIMGALFFFAKSLWEKMNAEKLEVFDERVFWAGLWFRLGSAIVFTMVIFLALSYKGYSDAIRLMPFVALLIGLSVKSAENLVSGLCERMFNAINTLVK